MKPGLEVFTDSAIPTLIANRTVDKIHFGYWFKVSIPQNDSSIFRASCKTFIRVMNGEHSSLTIHKVKINGIECTDQLISLRPQNL